MFYEPKKQDHGMQMDPFKSCVVPRPIGWISTLDPEGRVNLAPYSFYNGISEDPPMVCFASTGVYGGEPIKHARRAAELTGEFVVNMVSEALKDAMNVSAAMTPLGVDEMKLAGLTAAPCRLVKAPRVAESPIAMECRWWRTIELPKPRLNADSESFLVIGEVIGIHIDDRVIGPDNRVDILKFNPLARLGYSEYSVANNKFKMPRPDNPKYS